MKLVCFGPTDGLFLFDPNTDEFTSFPTLPRLFDAQGREFLPVSMCVLRDALKLVLLRRSPDRDFCDTAVFDFASQEWHRASPCESQGGQLFVYNWGVQFIDVNKNVAWTFDEIQECWQEIQLSCYQALDKQRNWENPEAWLRLNDDNGTFSVIEVGSNNQRLESKVFDLTQNQVSELAPMPPEDASRWISMIAYLKSYAPFLKHGVGHFHILHDENCLWFLAKRTLVILISRQVCVSMRFMPHQVSVRMFPKNRTPQASKGRRREQPGSDWSQNVYTVF